MAKYTGTGTASRFAHHRAETRTVQLSVEAKTPKQAWTKAMRQMRDQFPQDDGYTHVVGLVEDESDE